MTSTAWTPFVYAILYVASAPLFFGSLAWLVRGLRRGRGILLPALATAVFFSLPTLYVLVAGRNLPAWAYMALVVLTLVGAVAASRRLRASLRRSS